MVATKSSTGPAVWRNWARTESAQPRRIVRARDVDDVVEAVRDAGREGLRVKAIGAGHSFSGAAVTDGVLIDLSALRRLDSIAHAAGGGPASSAASSAGGGGPTATVEAGITLHDVSSALDVEGLALSNLGDIDVQTLAGAISTGTHGTGVRLGGLATQVVALDLVRPDGALVHCSADERPELFQASRIGLGALGVVVGVTLRVEPAYDLEADERPMPIDDVLAGLDELVDGNDHFEFFWFPHTQWAATKRNNRVPAATPRRPVGQLRGWLDDELLSNTVFEWTNRLCARRPGLTPRVNRLAAKAIGARTYVDRSYRVFCSPRRVVFREMEYAVPRAALPDVFGEIRRWIDTSGERVAFPVEVRFAAADDIWLSTAYDRETAYVAVHHYRATPYQAYFRAVEAIAREVGGRPHWGKLHGRTLEDLAPVYPRLEDFRRVRAELDPTGRFANPYLDRVLGPIGG